MAPSIAGLLVCMVLLLVGAVGRSPLVIALTYPARWLGLTGWRGAFLLLGVLGLAWVWGFAEKPITHVQLVLTDCTIRDLPVDADGVYADVEGPETLHAGAWPYKVVGLTAAGDVGATHEVRLGSLVLSTTYSNRNRAPRSSATRVWMRSGSSKPHGAR